MAIKKISANLLGSNAVHTANIASGAISAADIADNSITAAKISASTSPTFGKLTLKDDFSSGVALTLDRTESGLVDNLFYIGVTSSVSPANDRMWFGTSTTDLTITDDGTVGIGTANPSVPLEVAGNIFINTSGNPNLTVKTSGAGNNPYVRIQADTNYWDLQTIFSNADDELDFRYNGTSKMIITNGGNVGIGETSPENILHIKKNASGSSYAADSSDLVIIENNSSAGIDLRTPTGDAGAIYFSDTTRARGAIIYYHSLDDMYFNVAGTSGAMVLDSSGAVGIGTNAPTTGFGGSISNVKLALLNGVSGGEGGTSVLLIGGDNKHYGYISGTHTANGLTYLDFGTASSATNPTVKMRLDSTGNLGVGHVTPQFRISLPQASDDSGKIGWEDGSENKRASILCNSSNDRLEFRTGTSDTLRMSIHGTNEDIHIGEGTSDVLLYIGSQGGAYGGNNSHWIRAAGATFMYNCGSGSHVWEIVGSQKMSLSSSGHLVNTGKQGIMGAAASADIACQSGTSTPSTKQWRWGGNNGNDTGYFINTNNNGVYLSYGSGSWTTHSDERLKENIEDIGSVLNLIQDYRCVKFNLKSTPEREVIGFIAQDWETDFPQVVDEDTGFTVQENGTLLGKDVEGNTSTSHPKSISYTETIPVLLKAIQELKQENDALKARLDSAGL